MSRIITLICRDCKKEYSRNTRGRAPTYQCRPCQNRAHENRRKDRKRVEWNEYARTLRGQFVTSRNKAKRSGRDWTITFEEYKILRSMSCHYCGGALPESSRGLDRIDNSEGYLTENVLPCCGGCNTFRSNVLTVEETEQLVSFLRMIRYPESLWK